MSLGNVIDMALSQVGTTEYPPNSNKVKYNTEYYGSPVSGPSYPWCITFLWWCFSHGGESSAFYGGGKTASSTTLMTYYQNQGRFVTSGYQLGDIVFYNFDGGSGADHAEIIVGVGNGKYTTIGGNTTPGEEGSQNNGGCVARKTRYPSQFLGAGRPAYAGSGGGGGSTPSSLRAKIIRATTTVLAMHTVMPIDVMKFQDTDAFIFTIDTRRWTYSTAPYDLDNRDYKFRALMDGTVNWGDGISEHVVNETSGWVSHTYDNPGMYKIKITGDLRVIRLGYEESYPQIWITRNWSNCLISVDTALPPTIIGVFTSCGLFGHCLHLEKIPKDYLSKIAPENVSANYMFADCYSLKSIDRDFFRNNVNLTSFAFCFYRTGLRSIPNGLFDYFPLAKNFRYCFALSDRLAEIPENLFANIPQDADFSYCFQGCLGITGNVPRLWETHPNATHVETFRNCFNAANYADIPSDWR